MKRVILVFIMFFNFSLAQGTFQFLNLENSPRAAALGGTFVAATNDVNVLFYNPAGINKLVATPVSFSFLKHLEGINSASLVGSYFLEDYGRFAGAVQYINYGSFTKADEYGNKTGEFGATDLAISLSYGNELGKNFYYGASIRFIYSGIDSYSSTGISSDLGLLYLLPEYNWAFGFSVLNLGSQLSSYVSTTEELPLNVRLGFTKELQHLPLKIYFNFNKLNSSEDSFLNRFNNWAVGGELKMSQSIVLRIGYDNEKRDELVLGEKAGLSGFNAGFGFTVKQYVIDYAFSSFGPIGNLHRFGLSTTF